MHLANLQFIDILEYVGTFAFAISGIRMASAKRFDWFGAYVVGLATAIGGGTVRDLLLGVQPFWMNGPSYLVWTAVALGFALIFRQYLRRMDYTLFIFDAIGLSFFTVVGMQKSLDFGQPFWVSIIMGVLTGCAGGIMRDVLINEVPLIFKKEIYATASILGGLVLRFCVFIGLHVVIAEVLGALIILVVRIVAMQRQLALPILKQEDEEAGG